MTSQSRRENDHLATMFNRHESNSRGDEHNLVLAKKLSSTAMLPTYAHDGDAGADLYSDEDCEVYAMTTRRVRTSCAVALPPTHAGLICPRSGLAAKHDVTVLNAPGIIDSNYRGSVDVLLANFGSSTFRVQRGDRIAQLVVMPVMACKFVVEAASLDGTGRGSQGFGSTGTGVDK